MLPLSCLDFVFWYSGSLYIITYQVPGVIPGIRYDRLQLSDKHWAVLCVFAESWLANEVRGVVESGEDHSRAINDVGLRLGLAYPWANYSKIRY